MDAAQKYCMYMAILAFNLTFVVFTILFNSALSPFGYRYSVLKVLLALLISSGAAAGAYFGAKMTQ